MRIYRQLLIAAGVALLLLAGCGYNGSNSSAPGTPGLPTASTVTVSRQPDATAIATHGVQPTLATTGQVLLLLSRPIYQARDTLLITVRNQSGKNIFTVDHQTNCSVIQLQRQVNGSWAPVSPCRLMIMTRKLPLNAGASIQVKLAPPGSWQAGLYRARLSYSTAAAGKIGAPTFVDSAPFRIA